jgi:hypothetical protein
MARRQLWRLSKSGVAEQSALANDVRHLGRDGFFPAGIAGADQSQHVMRTDRQVVLVIPLDRLNGSVVIEVSIEVLEIVSYAEIVCGDQFATLMEKRIDVELHALFKEAAETLQNASFKIAVILLVKNLDQGRHAQR